MLNESAPASTGDEVLWTRRYGDVIVDCHPTAEASGREAAARFAGIVANALQSYDHVSVILATGNSQLPFFAAVRDRSDIDWSRIDVFHMDEYLGMDASHPASFRRYLREQLVDTAHPRSFHGIEGDAADIDAEMARYSELLRAAQPVVCVLGIGENGHLAFNDPPADFDTAELVHIVELDDVCRRQQWGEGHFPTLEAVPHRAITLTVTALLSAGQLLVLVPERRKAEAVRNALEGPVTNSCPASILQKTAHARVLLDADAASLLDTAAAVGTEG